MAYPFFGGADAGGRGLPLFSLNRRSAGVPLLGFAPISVSSCSAPVLTQDYRHVTRGHDLRRHLILDVRPMALLDDTDVGHVHRPTAAARLRLASNLWAAVRSGRNHERRTR